MSNHFNKRNIFKIYLLYLSSFSYFVYVIAYVGRDGSIYWIMSFLYVYVFFRPYLKLKEIFTTRVAILFALPVLFMPFIFITNARFEKTNIGAFGSIVIYGGGQIHNFNDQFEVEKPFRGGRYNFPVIYRILEYTTIIDKSNFSREDDFKYYIDKQVQPWTFATFIGSLVKDFGNVGTLLFIIMFCLIFRVIISNIIDNNTIYYSQFILFTLFYQFIYWGVFYNRMYAMNLYIIIMVILFIIFKLYKSKQYSITLLPRLHQHGYRR